MSCREFNVVLLDISNQLTADQLKDIKFLVRDVVGKRELEKVDKGLRLFELLTERNKLAADNTDYLSGLLRQVHQHRLSDRLDSFTSGAPGAPGPTGPTGPTGAPGPTGPTGTEPNEQERERLDVASEVVAANLGRSWRKLGRRLGVGDVKLESISQHHQLDLEEMALQLLKEWRRSRGGGATTHQLIQALRSCQFNLTADRVEDRLAELETCGK
ncbi:FAS-associated death domain protein [Embiotoca jacksoni]|uniref:FAS-associated death domain protein n=1 Tax=Embiotoca jacksoni TaxID=100190 RepID=UPI0037043A10